jgi:hypothetical protein
MSSTVASSPAQSTTSSSNAPKPEYPSTILAGDQISVPYPRESYPEWTTDRPRFDGKPSSFSKLISLPDPRKYPAFYAAPTDTIWIKNMRLQVHAPYHVDPLEKEHMTPFAGTGGNTIQMRTRFPFSQILGHC